MRMERKLGGGSSNGLAVLTWLLVTEEKALVVLSARGLLG